MKQLGIISIVIILAAFAGIVFKVTPGDSAPPAQPPAAMPVSVAVVTAQEITEWSEFSGRLKAMEDVQIRPRVSGNVDAVHFHESDIVQKGDTLFTIDMRPYKAAYDQASAQVDSAQAQLDMATSDKKRAQKLMAEKALSQREFDEKNNAQKSAAAALKAAQSTFELAALNLEYAEVKAPISGRVGRADITVGNYVQAGQQVLTTIQSVSPIYADFDMDEQTYLRTKKAMSASDKNSDIPVFLALADEAEFIREGKFRSFDNQLSGDSGTLRVRAEFDNADGFLTPGLFARIRMGGAKKQKAILINESSIGTDQNRKFVYVVAEGGDVTYRPVLLGPLNNGLRIISDGLQEGDKIIVNGLMRVHPGMKVQPMIVSMETLAPIGEVPAAEQKQ